jgi:hypothetical protein
MKNENFLSFLKWSPDPVKYFNTSLFTLIKHLLRRNPFIVLIANHQLLWIILFQVASHLVLKSIKSGGSASH